MWSSESEMSGGILHFNDLKQGCAQRLGWEYGQNPLVRKDTVTQNTKMVVRGYMYPNAHHSTFF
jgi:hypothetical protein